jgi:uncharacterized membrane protein
VDPLHYYGNVFFYIKLGLLVLAGANALAFHVTAERWDEQPQVTTMARRTGAVSLLLWSATIVSGRLIAYNWFN